LGSSLISIRSSNSAKIEKLVIIEKDVNFIAVMFVAKKSGLQKVVIKTNFYGPFFAVCTHFIGQ